MTTLDFGIEIECLLPRINAGRPMTQARLAEVVTAAGVPCYAAGYNHALSRQWKVVSDGSLRPGAGQDGYELVSPPLDENGLDQVTKVCEALTALNATVNRSCGLHVHVGARTLGVPAMKKLAELYMTHEPIIDTLLPASRRQSNCPYAMAMTGTNVALLAAATDVNMLCRAVSAHTGRDDRYSKVNFSAFWRHGTVEFRHHSGTVSAEKIIKWIVLCNALVATAKKEANNPVAGGNVSVSPNPRGHPYWRRGGRRRQMLFTMLTRPEGVTRQELATALNLRSLPLIRRHLVACGASTRAVLRRGGHNVFRLLDGVTQPDTLDRGHGDGEVITHPVTLDGFCTRLELSPEDKAYWEARKASFTPTGQDREVLAEARARLPRGYGETITGRIHTVHTEPPNETTAPFLDNAVEPR